MKKTDFTNIKPYYTDKGKLKGYRVRLEYHNECGKRSQISRNFSIKKYVNEDIAYENAIKCRDEKRVEIKQGTINKIEAKYTIDEIFEMTIKSMEQSLETKRKWGLWYKKYILNQVSGSMLFSNITWDNHIKPSLDSMVNNCSQDLIDRVKSIWRKMCLFAYSRDYVKKNQMSLADTSGKICSKAVIKPRNKKINMDELRKLIKEFPFHKENERLAFIEISALKIMAYIGLRPAEVFVLEEKDIDLKNRTINIYKRLGSTTEEKNVATSLGNKGYKRLVPYPESLDELIKELIEKSEDGKLFTVGGIYLNSNTLSGDVKRISNGKINPYMLRHAFSNNLVVDKGNSVENAQHNTLSSHTQQVATQGIMGHANIKRTRDYTTDLSKDEMELAIKKEKEDEFNEQVKAVRLRAKELDDLGLCVKGGVKKMKK